MLAADMPRAISRKGIHEDRSPFPPDKPFVGYAEAFSEQRSAVQILPRSFVSDSDFYQAPLVSFNMTSKIEHDLKIYMIGLNMISRIPTPSRCQCTRRGHSLWGSVLAGNISYDLGLAIQFRPTYSQQCFPTVIALLRTLPHYP